MASANYWLDTRTKLKGTEKAPVHPLKIQVYHNGKQFLTATKFYLTKEQFTRATEIGGNKTAELKRIGRELKETLEDANKILQELHVITKDNFRKVFNAGNGIYRRQYSTDLKELYDLKIKELEREGRLDTARNYLSSYKSLNKFQLDLELTDITDDFIKRFEKHTIAAGKSRETVKTHLRWLKAIMNIALSKGLLQPSQMPFGRGKIEIGGSVSAKSALTEKELLKFHEYQPETESRQRAKDFWWFIFHCNGINPADLVRLTWNNIEGDFIVFARNKTVNSKRTVTYSKAYFSDDLRAILDRLQVNKEKYIFGIINDKMDVKTQRRKIANWQRNTNKLLGKIASKLRIPELNLYAARHSFSTVMANEGVDINAIREYLNHTTTKQTENYIASLPLKRVKEHASALTKFMRVGKALKS